MTTLRLSRSLRFDLAFAAGMVAPVNPCGFALLPAWITGTIATGGTGITVTQTR
mgnify:CR=1 FL=1